MAAQVTDYKCPACTGPLRFNGKLNKLECEYCGSTYELAEVEAMYEAANAQAVAEKEKADAKAAEAKTQADEWEMESTENWGLDEGMKAYGCPSCGAELICDQNTAATCCPYCGNQTVVPGQFSGSLKPDYVIPFKTDKKQAMAALKKHYEGKKLLPTSFATGNHIKEIQGVYVPFWLYDCEAYGSAQYEGRKSEKQKTDKEEITTTRHYNVYREGKLAFTKVPVDASSKMPDKHMDSIEPYDYSELKEFSMAYMPGFLADRYDEDVETCGKRMEERCITTFEDAIDDTVTGYDSEDKKSHHTAIDKGEVHYAMMPVWLLATKWNDKSFLFAMNGQTGKLVGDLPVDKKKYWSYFGAIAGILIAIFMGINFGLMSKPLVGFGMVLIDIMIPLLIALISCSVMKSGMKSVRFQKANAYITGGGLKLSRKDDIYSHTTESRRKLEN